jgi:hypothetical protein
MASTNFIQFNPTGANQESDVEYVADSQRSGGYGTDNIVPSPLLNKATYQPTTFCAAFGQMMAAKGYSTSDANVAVLAAVLANIVTEADLLSNLVSVAYSPTPAFNAAAANGFQMTLTGNVTSSTISGVVAGQVVGFFFIQDATGGRTVAWPSSFVGAVQPDPTPNAVSLILFKADLSANLHASGPAFSNNGVFATNGLVCPTRTSGDNTTNAATTAFVQSAIASGFTSGSNANGRWAKDPSGLIRQWGTVAGASTGTIVDFPIAFTNSSSIAVNTTSLWYGPGNSICFVIVTKNSISTTQFEVALGVGSPQDFQWFAIGY